MLRRHMPELVPTWEHLVNLADGDELAARMLALWHPPRFLPGCSQAVVAGEEPVLIRNYDYHPDLWERVVYSSAFSGRRVIGTSDCLWGLLDGMNDTGLVISLAFGGRRDAAEGFGIPLVVRYLLEVADTVADVISVLGRVPVSMAYNLTVLDGNGDAVTVFVAPDARPEVFRPPAATNHRATTPDWPDHARSVRSVERQQRLLALLAGRSAEPDVVAAFLRPPLYNTSYADAFGTLYTAVYRPALGAVDYVWPRSAWRRHFGSPDATHTPGYDAGPAADPGWLDLPSTVPQAVRMCSQEELVKAGPGELAGLAEAAVRSLARKEDPAAFAHLLRLTRVVGECVGSSARALAAERSWSGVAEVAGTSKQAAWERWRGR
jgi:predicted choloylglycine hydrolase